MEHPIRIAGNVLSDAPIEVGPQRTALRILVAEDNPANQKLLQLILACIDAKVDCVENGAEAVAATAAAHYDLIFMDVQMPVMDGLTAIRRIRESERLSGRCRTPIYTVTANVLPEQVRAALDAGADQQIAKPISAPTIFRAVEQAQALTAA